jgi:hypothetical protein
MAPIWFNVLVQAHVHSLLMASATSLPKQAWQREVMDNNTHAYVEDMKNSNT